MTTWAHSDITDAADELDNTGGPGGDSVRALLEDYDLAAAEVETVRAVAQGNKRHVAILTKAYEELEARALAEDARERLARHLWNANAETGDDDTFTEIAARLRSGDGRWLQGHGHLLSQYEAYITEADDLLAVITGKAATAGHACDNCEGVDPASCPMAEEER